MMGKEANASSETITMTVFNQRLFMQTILRADIGLGECYMNGDFDVDLIGFMDMICKGHPAASGAETESCKPKMRLDPVGLLTEAVNWVGAQMEMAAHKALSNTKEGSRKNIEYHYDAGNEFYKLFLDDTMLYSSAIHGAIDDAAMSVDVLKKFKTFEAQEKHLEEAQYLKIDAMIARAGIKPGDRVLEIGCGWGTCAIRMASEKNCHVTGLTLSHEQHAEATARVKAAGLSHLIDIVICDYRDVQGTFDKVVSIEMLEAVGHEHLPTFFGTVHRVLKPGGRAAIQVITMPDGRYESYCNSESDFIRAYIFPGGHLPSVGAMKSASPRGLVLEGYDDIGLHYAVTLRLWRERMMHHAQRILSMGYSRKFLRMFEFYFAYCEAAFANKLIYDLQMTWVKKSDDASRSEVSTSSIAPEFQYLAVVVAICAMFAQRNPSTVTEMLPMAVPLLVGVVAVFSCATFLAAVVSSVALPQLGKKVSKVKLAEASSAHGTLMERSLALSVPLTKAVVAAAVGTAAYRFIDDTQNVRAAAISWILPNERKQAGKLAAVELLKVYVMVMVGRVVVDGARRERGEMFRRVVALAVTLLALHHDVFVVAIACSLITELRDATVHFRTFARTASGFPHYETVAYAASQRLAVVAFYVFQAIPTVYAIYALSAHIRAGTLPPKSPLGAIAIIATTASAIRAVRASVADAQLAVADRVIRRRILDVSTSAEI
jgi:cyclopropane fatty-acyl-phospholipid synthase-like methyltransferase